MKISIITATYNSAATIRDTLECIKHQVYADIEHIIVDGVSKDNTLEIVKEYPHVAIVISEPDKGIYDAMNKGIALASGQVIGILNSDDVYESNDVIQKIYEGFVNNPDVDLIYANISFVENGNTEEIKRIWESIPYYDQFFEDGEVPPHPSLFVKKKVYDKIGIYYPGFKISSDYEFMLRAIKVNNYKTFHINQSIVRMRLGGDSTKGIHNLFLNNKEVYLAWKMNGLSPPLKFYFKRPFKKILQLIRAL